MPFKDTNIASRLRINDRFKIGKSDLDTQKFVEKDILLPWPSDPLTSWIYYDCAVGVMLDSGIVVHNHLPQYNGTFDSLASCNLDDSNMDKIAGPGVNLQSADQYTDIVHRMGHSRYWFRIWGQALRVGLRVPIPGIKFIGGVPAIPYDMNPQWAFNRIAPNGNYSGVVLWHAAWSLWYTTAVPPRNNEIPAADAAGHIRGTTKGPDVRGIQSPYSQPDNNASRTRPGGGILDPPPVIK